MLVSSSNAGGGSIIVGGGGGVVGSPGSRSFSDNNHAGGFKGSSYFSFFPAMISSSRIASDFLTAPYVSFLPTHCALQVSETRYAKMIDRRIVDGMMAT